MVSLVAIMLKRRWRIAWRWPVQSSSTPPAQRPSPPAPGLHGRVSRGDRRARPPLRREAPGRRQSVRVRAVGAIRHSAVPHSNAWKPGRPPATMAVLSVLGAVVFGLVFGVGKLLGPPGRLAEEDGSWSSSSAPYPSHHADNLVLLRHLRRHGHRSRCVLVRHHGLTFYNGAGIPRCSRAARQRRPSAGREKQRYAIGMRKTQVMNIRAAAAGREDHDPRRSSASAWWP